MVRFLIIRFDSPEEVELALPVARKLKKVVDEAEIHFLTMKENACRLEEELSIDQLHVVESEKNPNTIELKKLEIDYIIDLQHDGRTSPVKFRLKRYDFSIDTIRWTDRLRALFTGKLRELKPLEERYLDTISIFLDE